MDSWITRRINRGGVDHIIECKRAYFCNDDQCEDKQRKTFKAYRGADITKA